MTTNTEAVPLLVWSEEKPPCEEVAYNHVVAETPFGRFLITWKGWKEYDSPTIDETPWGDYGGAGYDLSDAKSIAEAAYAERLRAVVIPRITEAGLREALMRSVDGDPYMKFDLSVWSANEIIAALRLLGVNVE